MLGEPLGRSSASKENDHVHPGLRQAESFCGPFMTFGGLPFHLIKMMSSRGYGTEVSTHLSIIHKHLDGTDSVSGWVTLL